MPIAESVGVSGSNLFFDVLRVQSLLNEFRNDNGRLPIGVDGKVGPETVGAIKDFQQAVTHIVDGRIDPNGPAITKLEELVQDKIFEAGILGMIGLISEYDPRVANVHSGRTLAEIIDSLLDERIG